MRQRFLGLVSAVGVVIAVSVASAVVGQRHPRRTGARLPGGRYEYVVSSGVVHVYRVGGRPRLVLPIPLPGVAQVRGVAADARAHALFVSFGGFGGPTGTGALRRIDLLSGRTVWTRSYGTGVDSIAISRDGLRLFVPTGEADPSGTWLVVAARDGRLLGRLRGGAGAHNTVIGADGRRVFLGGRDDNRLAVASTASDRIVERIGPLLAGVRPFTVDRRGVFAVTTATRFSGFQVSSVRTGRVIQTVAFAG